MRRDMPAPNSLPFRRITVSPPRSNRDQPLRHQEWRVKWVLVHYLVCPDAPDVGRADIAAAIADRDPAPAVGASVDPADDAVLGAIADLGAVVGLGADR